MLDLKGQEPGGGQQDAGIHLWLLGQGPGLLYLARRTSTLARMTTFRIVLLMRAS